MTDATLVMGAALSFLTAGLYAYVGRIMFDREATGPARRALGTFATWWLALAALTLLQGIQLVFVAAGTLQVELHVALTHLKLLPVMVGAWGLLYYLLYLHTGRESLFTPLTFCYALVYAYFTYLLVWMQPVDVVANGLAVQLVPARELPVGMRLGALLLLYGPLASAAALYGSLLFRLRDRLHRYRVALVSGSFFLWFGILPTTGFVTGLTAAPWWPLLSRAVGVLVPVLVILAYRPPRPLRVWLDTRPLHPGEGAAARTGAR